MTLIKRNPETDLNTVFGGWDPFDRLMDSWLAPRFTRAHANGSSLFSPPVDIQHDKDEIVLKAELPGMNRDDIEITVHENTLTLRGTKKTETSESKEGYTYSERQYGEFMRTFQLPASVDAGKVKAEYKDGVLSVHMPVAEEAKPRKIEVKAQ